VCPRTRTGTWAAIPMVGAITWPAAWRRMELEEAERNGSVHISSPGPRDTWAATLRDSAARSAMLLVRDPQTAAKSAGNGEVAPGRAGSLRRSSRCGAAAVTLTGLYYPGGWRLILRWRTATGQRW
jgi:hypothetical protein